MTTKDFTPGPLHVIEPLRDRQCAGIVDNEMNVVAYIGIDGRPNIANARLYAAAPDLLAACECEQAFYSSVATVELVAVLQRHGYEGAFDLDECENFVTRLRNNAIAKAKGEAP